MKRLRERFMKFWRAHITGAPAFRCRYEYDNAETTLMSFEDASSYAEIFRGEVIYCPEDYACLLGHKDWGDKKYERRKRRERN